MKLTVNESTLRGRPPQVDDEMIAARVSSFLCWLAAMSFFVSPWTYFGVSEDATAWNAWIVGGMMILISMARLWKPILFTPLAWMNTALGAWAVLSPWIIGYVRTAQAVNSVVVGLVIVAGSLMSRATKEDYGASDLPYYELTGDIDPTDPSLPHTASPHH